MLKIKKLTSRSSSKGIIDNIDLVCPTGKIHAIIGNKDAGKSTLLDIIGSRTCADSGVVYIDGETIKSLGEQYRSFVGFLFLSEAICCRLTSDEYLDMLGAMYGVSDRIRKAKVEYLVESLNLPNEGYVDSFSYDDQKKLKLAATLVHSPRYLVLYEPLDGVSTATKRVMSDVLRDLAMNGTTILYTTSHIDCLDEVADLVSIIDAGKIIYKSYYMELKKIIAKDCIQDTSSLVHTFNGI
ncbi:ABC transporter ATP-binding protein [Halosquirtibacter xylanolyticus]|uniref:ATP-binding cassette domain-containing protein n=1 Tax=Halosquirtibacter xylanolyticus TaxID=3374599 RepID=UPI00374A1410|nr:ABC transporter ATP-binding protein [Prolixibacteraceae bacterium]